MADAGGKDHHVAGLHFLLNASHATEAYGGGTTKTTESLVRFRMVMWEEKHRCAPIVAPLVGVKGFFDQLRRHIVECAGIKQERQLGIVRDAAVVLEEEGVRFDGVDPMFSFWSVVAGNQQATLPGPPAPATGSLQRLQESNQVRQFLFR